MAAGFHEDLTCSVCLDLFTEPVLLSCGHCFCQKCITSFWDRQERNATCPECRAPCPDKQCTPNRLLGNLAKRAWVAHPEANSSTVQKDAEISEERQAEGEKEGGRQMPCCEAHGEPFELFCIVDETPICYRCVDSSVHAGHRFCSLKDGAQSYKEKLDEALGRLGTRIQGLEEREGGQKEKICSLKDSAASLRKNIEDTFSVLHQALHDRQAEMLVQLDKDEKDAHDNMEGRLQQIQERLHAAQESMSQGKNRKELNNPGAFLLGIRRFLDTLPSKAVQSEGDKDDLAVLHKELCLGKFKGPNQHLACRPLSPVFMQELEPVQLDPSTAHPMFVITDEGTHVTVRKEFQKYRGNLQRFQNCCIVLGGKGFTAGRHYWEIEAEVGAGWLIGVTAESIDRNIDLELKNFIGKSWFLNLKETEISAGKSSCRRIGVYLDYEEGQVSFYDAKGGSHLGTHRVHFKKKIYPFFLNFPVDSKVNVSLSICQK